MPITYSLTAVNGRLEGLADAIDSAGAGLVVLRSSAGAVLSSIVLSLPCGTVHDGVLTFVGDMRDDSADATGSAENAIITAGDGTVMVTGLTVGIPLSGADVIISNGLSSTVISSGQNVALLSAQIAETP